MGKKGIVRGMKKETISMIKVYLEQERISKLDELNRAITNGYDTSKALEKYKDILLVQNDFEDFLDKVRD